jgi:hypothetical protein
MGSIKVRISSLPQKGRKTKTTHTSNSETVDI